MTLGVNFYVAQLTIIIIIVVVIIIIIMNC